MRLNSKRNKQISKSIKYPAATNNLKCFIFILKLLRSDPAEMSFYPPENSRKLFQQISSGCGTQQNDSKDEPTYAESIELQTLCPVNCTEIDSVATPLLQRNNSEPAPTFAYLQYDKERLPRSHSYQKPFENISLRIQPKSMHEQLNTSNRSLEQISMISHSHHSNPIDAPKNIIARVVHDTTPKSDLSFLRIPSDQSLNTLSNDQDEVFVQPNLRDELLSCDQKELFQFLSDDFDNTCSHNYFSDTVGFGSALIDPDTDSLIFDSKRDEHVFSPARKTSTASNKSNLSYISSSIFETLEHNRGGSISESVDRRTSRQKKANEYTAPYDEREPLVKDSEFENIIASFEKELTAIKNSTPSLVRNLSMGSRAFDGKAKSPFDVSSSTHTYEEILPLRPNSAKSHRNSVKLKRRSLEKQMQVDDGFNVSNEIKKICDHMQAPFSDNLTKNNSLIISPKTRRKNTNFHSSFDRIKRSSLIERVDESIEDERYQQQAIAHMHSEQLPRKYFKNDVNNIESISLKSTGSYEKLICNRDTNKDTTDTKKIRFVGKADAEKGDGGEKKTPTKSPTKSKKGMYEIAQNRFLNLKFI